MKGERWKGGVKAVCIYITLLRNSYYTVRGITVVESSWLGWIVYRGIYVNFGSKQPSMNH